MKKFTFNYLSCLIAGILFCAITSSAQISFKNTNTKLTNPNMHSGCSITVADMNGDGLDDIVRLNGGQDVYIEYQKPGNQFQSVHIANIGGGSEWGMCVADVDHNGFNDILAGGNNNPSIELLKLDANGLMGSIIHLSTASLPNYFMQNANFMDVNNDGWEDIFTCNDNGPSVIWTNDGAGNFALSNIIDFSVHPWSISGDPADAGNYGSVWTDFDNDGDIDLYVAHCRQGVNSSSDPRRIDQLFVNNGNNTYTQLDTAYNVADSMETWTASFGDIDNDGDLDLLLTEQNSASRIMENDGTGHYTEITSTTGLVLSVQPIESVMEDFDNDGYLDILVTGASSQLFHNNKNKTFTEVTNVFDNNDMESFAVGDLNHDGKIDVYGGYGTIYTSPSSINDVVWINSTGNSNNFITFHLTGTTSNITALGARAEIYGAWGKQIREVRSGESYGTCNTADLHFGLGTASVVDSVVIRWPSGTITHINNPVINQFISIIEGSCVSPDNVITASGPLMICTGQSVTLNAAPGYQYIWSDGSTGQSIVVSTEGEYSVTIIDTGNSCYSTSATNAVLVNPDQTPIITTSATNLNICEGSDITLTSTPANSYLWSNGDTTQSTIVGQTGNYSVTIQGVCQSWPSNAIALNVYPAPAPISGNVNLSGPGVATLAATGNNIAWYNVATGGVPLITGPNYTTPFLTHDTVFYAEDSYSYGGGTSYTGQLYHTGGDYSGSTANGYNIFDVFQNCVLKTVKVYTDTPGDRLIELRDFNDNVLQSVMVNIPVDTSVITLNFNLAPGTSYHLGTNDSLNTLLLGFVTPRLKRSDSGVNYPYSINNLVTLYNSSAGTGYYYYFYDWEVEEPATICISNRTPVYVFVPVGIQNISSDNHIKFYPNPANGNVNITFDENIGTLTTINILDVSGRVISYDVYDQLSKGQIVKLDVSKISAGTYMLNIKNKDMSFTRSLTIMQ